MGIPLERFGKVLWSALAWRALQLAWLSILIVQVYLLFGMRPTGWLEFGGKVGWVDFGFCILLVCYGAVIFKALLVRSWHPAAINDLILILGVVGMKAGDRAIPNLLLFLALVILVVVRYTYKWIESNCVSDRDIKT